VKTSAAWSRTVRKKSWRWPPTPSRWCWWRQSPPIARGWQKAARPLRWSRVIRSANIRRWLRPASW